MNVRVQVVKPLVKDILESSAGPDHKEPPINRMAVRGVKDRKYVDFLIGS